MRITRVTSTALVSPSAEYMLRVHTDDGLAGIAVGTGAEGNEARQLGSDRLVGEDPRAVVALWQKLQSGHSFRAAIALLDVALWDLKAKSNGEPLWKTFGGARPRANAYARCDGTSTELLERCGLREAKISTGPDIAADARALAALRDVLLQNTAYPVLMIDSGDRWTPERAISNIGALEESFDLTSVECADAAWGQAGLRKVSDNIFAAVCANGFSARDPHAADIVQLSLRTSGITGTLQIADAAYGFELPVTLGASPGNIAAHLAAAIPNFMSMEVSDPDVPDSALRSDVMIEDGRAVAGDRPGHGLDGSAV